MADPLRDETVRLSLPCHVASVATARRRLAEHLLAAGCGPQLVHDGAIVLCELLMNAIVHGAPDPGGEVQVSWTLDRAGDGGGAVGDLTVRVRDSGLGGLPRLEQPTQTEGGGRGLILVERLCRSWRVHTDGITEVTAVLDVRPA